MTDPRIDVLVRLGHLPPRYVLQALDAADSAAGVVRVDLNDRRQLQALAEAIMVSQHGETNEQWRVRLIRAALQPEHAMATDGQTGRP
jgi:carotenoid cleavage dioxygenase-like enzyme